LLELNPDVVPTSSTVETALMTAATKTIPIVFATANDPIGNGFVQSLARPGGNVTGFTNSDRDGVRAYAPAAGRLAAAIATIWDSRRPIRDGAPRRNERSCCISHLPSAPVEQRSSDRRTTENGLTRLTSRDPSENSNARVVRTPAGSGFIAAMDPAAGEIFSPVPGL
jgi:hypothetical protein